MGVALLLQLTLIERDEYETSSVSLLDKKVYLLLSLHSSHRKETEYEMRQLH